MGSVLGTTVVGVILLAIVGALVWKMISDKKREKGAAAVAAKTAINASKVPEIVLTIPVEYRKI